MICAPATSSLRCPISVYVYLITGYNTPEQLGRVVSCVPAPYSLPPHSLAVDAIGVSLYVPTPFRCRSLLTVHVETEVIPNVSHLRSHTYLELP